MKKPFLFFSLFLSGLLLQAQAVRTTIANGIATNPFIWDCTCLPLPNDSIIINHALTLNVNFGFTDGAVVINPGGSVIGDDPQRAFAFSGGAYFKNDGFFRVARVAFAGGIAINNNVLEADSFFTNITTGNGFVSNGNMNITTSYWNTGTFRLNSGASLVVRDNFYNGDSLISGVTAVLVNNGAIRVNQDFANSDTLTGTGQICIDGNSVNAGVITGTLDMCDLSGGGNVDYNFGTISPTVTTCLNACEVGIEEENTIASSVYPNPAEENIQIKAEGMFDVVVYDLLGHQVYKAVNIQSQLNLGIGEWATGTYIYHLIRGNARATGKFVKQ